MVNEVRSGPRMLTIRPARRTYSGFSKVLSAARRLWRSFAAVGAGAVACDARARAS